MDQAEFPGELRDARRLPLVGREQELQQIQATMMDEAPSPHVTFVLGEGGIGKTRLLDESLKGVHGRPGVLAAKVVDLYDTRTHTKEGLAKALYAALVDGSGPECDRVETALADYMRRRLAQDRKERQTAPEAFVAGLRILSQDSRVILALDTAERLIYGSLVSASPETPLETAPAWQWLKGALPQLGRVTLLLAGRPLAERLLPRPGGLAAVASYVDIGDLEPDQAFEYLRRAADSEVTAPSRPAPSPGPKSLIEALSELDAHIKERVQQCTGGRPIKLAILAEYLRSGIQPLKDASDIEAALDSLLTSENIEATLIGTLRDMAAGEVIIHLGHLSKGADKEMIAAVMPGLSDEEIQHRLSLVEHLTFVKVRGDGRFFLHDELYDLLDKYGMIEKPGDGPEGERIERGILRYYRTQLSNLADQFAQFYDAIEMGDRPHAP